MNAVSFQLSWSENVASHYTRAAERWLIIHKGTVHCRELINKRSTVSVFSYSISSNRAALIPSLIAQPSTRKQHHLWLQMAASAWSLQGPAAQWESPPVEQKRSIQGGLRCLLILFHFIVIFLTAPHTHNMELSSFLSFPQGKPMATHVSYLNWSWKWSEACAVALLHWIQVACEFYIFLQVTVAVVYERPFLCWEERLDTGKCPGQVMRVPWCMQVTLEPAWDA